MGESMQPKTYKRLDFEKLNAIFKNGENDTTEFKSHIHRPEAVAQIITAFANTKGGIIIIGYDERTQSITGCSSKDQVIVKKALEFIDTPPKIESYTVEMDGKALLIVQVDKSINGLSFLNGVAYVRNGDRITKMRGTAIRQSLSNVSNEVLLEAITKLSDQNEKLSIKLDKSSRSSTIIAIITCVVSAVLGYLLGKFL